MYSIFIDLTMLLASRAFSSWLYLGLGETAYGLLMLLITPYS
jgi:hypothetical protein